MVTNTHFSGLLCTSLSCNRLKTAVRRFKCSDSVLAATKISVTKQHTPGKLVNILLSMVHCNNAGLEATSKGSLFILNNPLLVFAVQSSLLASSNSSCWNALLRSILENIPCSCSTWKLLHSTVVNGWCAISICVLTVVQVT